MGSKLVARLDVLRAWNHSLSGLNDAVERLKKQAIRKATDEARSLRNLHVNKMIDILESMKSLTDDARRKRADVQNIEQKHPVDPIASVIYEGLTSQTGQKPKLQSYQTQLSTDRDKLFVKSRMLKVHTITAVKSRGLNVTFVNSSLALSVEPLTTTTSAEMLSEGDTVLLLGYYMVLIEPEPSQEQPHEHVVAGYLRALAQISKPEHRGSRTKAQESMPEIVVLVWCGRHRKLARIPQI